MRSARYPAEKLQQSTRLPLSLTVHHNPIRKKDSIVRSEHTVDVAKPFGRTRSNTCVSFQLISDDVVAPVCAPPQSLIAVLKSRADIFVLTDGDRQ